MTFVELIEAINRTRKGTFTHISYITSPTLNAAGKKEGVVITKHTEKVVRIGVKRNNIAAVKAAEEARTTPKQERTPWCHWEIENVITKHNNKEDRYLTIANVNHGHHTKVRWFINGKEVTKQEVIDSGYVIPSYFKEVETPATQQINIENIISLGKPKK